MNTELSNSNFQRIGVFSNLFIYLFISFQTHFSDRLFISTTSSADGGKLWLDLMPHTHGRFSGIDLTQKHDH